MSPSWRTGLGVACLAGAAAIGAVAGRPAQSDVGASFGGARTIAVGSLFLRAEALRKEGRIEELPDVYRRILELDPGSDAAADHLADVLANDLRPDASTPAGRVRWWDEAMALVDKGLVASPGSARLHWRRGALLLRTAAEDDAVAASLRTRGRDRERAGVASLLEAARLSGGIPRLGRLHLEMLARDVPLIAARRLATKGEDVDWFLAAGQEALALRGPELDDVALEVGSQTVPAATYLRAGLRLVATVRADLAAKPPAKEEARALLSTYVKALGEDPVAQALRPLLE